MKDVITFGTYNGKPIEWLVLERSGDKKWAYILSKDILLKKAYNEEFVSCTWEDCTLRSWLNGEFLGNFTPQEQSRIGRTTIQNEDNLWYGTKGGNETKDRIFLPSLSEVDKYFGDSGDYLNKRRKKYDNGKFFADKDGYYFSNNFDKDRIANFNGSSCWWWLRSPGGDDDFVAYVYFGGLVDVSGYFVIIYSLGGVRPALWLNL